MVDMERLKSELANSGMTMTAIADKSGISRETLYNRLKGIGEFTASEIVGLSTALHFSASDVRNIFLQSKGN